MARNNYGFEKRQRELLKERKKEEKRQKKLERSNAEQVVDSTTQEPGDGLEDGPTDHALGLFVQEREVVTAHAPAVPTRSVRSRTSSDWKSTW